MDLIEREVSKEFLISVGTVLENQSLDLSRLIDKFESSLKVVKQCKIEFKSFFSALAKRRISPTKKR